MKYLLILLLVTFSVSVYGQDKGKYEYIVRYKNADIDKYIRTVNTRLSEAKTKIITTEIDTTNKRITFEVETRKDPENILKLLSVSGTFGIYSLIPRDSILSIKLNPEFFSNVTVADKNKNTPHSYISNELIGCSDTSFYLNVNPDIALATTQIKNYPSFSDPGSLCYAVYALDVNSQVVTNASIKEFGKIDKSPTGSYNLNFQFNDFKKWEEFTEHNINRIIALTLDHSIFSAPMVMSKILNGRCSFLLKNKEEAEIYKIIMQTNKLEIAIDNIQLNYVLEF